MLGNRVDRLVLFFVQPLVELGVRGCRDDGDDAPALAQVRCGLRNVVDSCAPAAPERRIHGDAVVLVDDVVVLKVAVDDLAVERQGQLGAQDHAGLDGGARHRFREPARNGSVAATGLEAVLAPAQLQPLNHLQADGLWRGKVVDAFLGLGLGVLLLQPPVDGLRSVVLRDRSIGKRIALLAASAFALVAGREGVGLLEGRDERIQKRPGLFALAQVLGLAGAPCDRLGKRLALPVGSGVQVAEDGIGTHAQAVDAALLLDRHRGLRRQPEVDEHPLMLARRVVARPALVLRRLHQRHHRPRRVVVELLVAPQHVGLLLVAVDEQRAGNLAHEALNGRDQVRQQGVSDKLRELGAELRKRRVVGVCAGDGPVLGRRFVVFLQNVELSRAQWHGLHRKRVAAAALLEVVEHHDLAAHRQVLLDDRDDLLGLDGLQEVAADQVPILAVQLVAHECRQRCEPFGLAAVVVLLAAIGLALGRGHVADPPQRIVDAVADGRVQHDEPPVIVRLNVERAIRQHAALLQPAIELALHHPAVHARVGLGQLAVPHPIPEVGHEEILVRAGRVVARRAVLVWVSLVVVEQVALGPVDRLVVGEGRCRQERDARALLRRHCRGLLQDLCAAGRQLLLQRLELLLEFLNFAGVLIAHHVHRVVEIAYPRQPGNPLRQGGGLCELFGKLPVEPLTDAARVPRHRPHVQQGTSGLAVSALHERMRFVGDDVIPVALDELVVCLGVGVGRDDDAFAGIHSRLQGRDVQPQRLARLDPVRHDLGVWNQDELVVLVAAREALDDAQAGERFARPRAVGEQHAEAVRLDEALLGLVNVLLLRWQQVGQSGPDVLEIAGPVLDGIGRALLRAPLQVVGNAERRLLSFLV